MLSALGWLIVGSSLAVETHLGPIVGTMDDDVRVWRGIPYAAPPVGKLRWRPPVDPQPWTTPRETKEFGAVAVQFSESRQRGLENQSEDCLFLNVWSSAEGENKPVFVWIHGGGHSQGASNMRAYLGDEMARKGAVFVSVNYRLGYLGYFAHPDLSKEQGGTSGNYGYWDQIHALKWVQRNIEKFGGNPGNVTIGGQSAGGVSVSVLMASPEAKGLFHRAFPMSGGAQTSSRSLAQAEREGVSVAEKVGFSNDGQAIAKMRELSWEELRSRAGTVAISIAPGAGVTQWSIIDGKVLPAPALTLIREGKGSKVPLMTGTTADEGTMFSLGANQARWNQYLRLFGDHRAEAERLYGSDAKAAVERIGGDTFLLNVRRTATAHQPHSPTFVYHFTRLPALLQRNPLKVFHGLDIPYFLGTGENALRRGADGVLSEQMQTALLNFMKHGNPNGEAPFWAPYDPAKDEVLIWDTKVRMEVNPRREAVDLIEKAMSARGFGD